MARTTVIMQYTLPFKDVDHTIRTILSGAGYNEITRNGEVIWKKGTGMLTAMQFIKIEYDEKTVSVSGWIQTGMGNVTGGEMDLNGLMGAMPKKSVMKVISQIQNTIR